MRLSFLRSVILSFVLVVFGGVANAATTTITSGDVGTSMSSASDGDIIILNGTTFTWTTKFTTFTKGITVKADPSLTTRPIVTLGAGVMLKFTGTALKTITFDGIDFLGAGGGTPTTTGFFSGAAATGGDVKLNINNCYFHNFTASAIFLQYTAVSGLAVYNDLTIANSRFVGFGYLLTTGTITNTPNNITLRNCLFGTNAFNGSFLTTVGTTNGVTVDHCTFNGCLTSSKRYFNIASGTPCLMTNNVFVNELATGNCAVTANGSSTNNTVFNCGGVATTRFPVASFGTLVTADPGVSTIPVGSDVDASYYTTTPAGNGYYNAALIGTPSPTSLSGFTYAQGSGPSSEQTFTVGGTDLNNNLTITAPSNYEVSLSSGTGFASSIVVSPTLGVVASTTIYVRLKSGLTSASSPYNQDIVISSLNATSINFACAGTVTGAATPVITPTGTLSVFSYPFGVGPAAYQSFTVAATDLTSDLTITPTSNMEVCLTSGGTYVSSIAISNAGTVATTNIYSRLKAGLAVGTYASENIALTATGATTQNVVVPNTSSVLESKTFTVNVPNGTVHVYIVGDFTGKNWDASATAYELTPTGTANQFGGTFACTPSISYKYLCDNSNDYDYQEAQYNGGGDPTAVGNHSWAATDNVALWFRVKSILMNVSFSAGVPSDLYVKGGWDSWTTPITLTRSGSTYSGTVSGFLSSKIPANTEYKYYTSDLANPNWEVIGSNRWSVAPEMDDNIAQFTTAINPTISTSASLSAFSYDTGNGPSVEQNFTVSGSYLNGNVTVTPPANYQISTTSGSGFISNPTTLSLSPTSGVLSSTPIYVRLKAGLSAGNYNTEAISFTATGATTQNVNCSGTVRPLISAIPSTLTGFTYVLGGGPSAYQSIAITGTELTADIAVTPPTNYEVCATSGGTYQSTSLTLAHSGGVVNTTIYVKLKAGLTVASYNSETIAITSANATTQNVTCSGEVTAPPPTSSVTVGTLTFTYGEGLGPSVQQSFGISASNLVDDITITGTTNYEISTSSGGSFTSSSPITLTQTGGVASGTIYVRLKAGLAAGTFNSENITITSSYTTTKEVICNGEVKPLVVDVYNPTLQASYPSLKDAFDKINDGTHTGILTIKLTASITETVSAVLHQSGYSGLSNYSSVHIYPTATGITINGDLPEPLIDLNGADNVIFDGRVNATGTTKDLVIDNSNITTTAGTSTIRFINDASSNVVKYCSVKGGTTDLIGGVIFFSTTTGSTGNDGNLIDNNNITSTTNTYRPANAIYSEGTSLMENSGNTISNNNLYDFFSRLMTTNAILLASNSITWSITGNSFYETADFTTTLTSPVYSIINVAATTCSEINITGNYFGGKAASCSGGVFTKTNSGNPVFRGIYLNVGTGTASSVQNNVFKNFSWSNIGTNAQALIYINDGVVNVGTSAGNTFGAADGPITLSSGGDTGTPHYGIYTAGTGAIAIQNNSFGSITIANTGATLSTDFNAIRLTGSGARTVSSNVIGSVGNGISCTSTSTDNTQTLSGIYSSASGTNTYTDNTIAYLSNASTDASLGSVTGMYVGTVATLSNNTIHDLTIANTNTASDYTSSVVGIAFSNATNKTVTSNTIYNLSNTNASFAGSVIGLHFLTSTGTNVLSSNTIYNLTTPNTTSASNIIGILINAAVSGTKTVNQNFIHSLSATSSNSANLYGIKIVNNGVATYANNIINLGDNTPANIYGIYDAGITAQTCNLFYNNIYIGGAPTSGALNSYALYNAANANTRLYKNNIFNNARSNNTASGKHYTAYIATSGGTLTMNYNDYYANGIGAQFGYYGADVTDLDAWKTATVQDAYSKSIDPLFTVAGGTTAANYNISSILPGVEISTITTDYAAATRTNPTMGAFNGPVNTYVEVWATGGALEASYASLRQAFVAINAGTHTADLDIKITGDITESSIAVLTGVGGYTSIHIYPTGAYTINGDAATPLIDMNGADNVTIDGQINGTGGSKDLTITNINTASTAGTSTIRFINDATNNTVKYLNIKGASTATASGILFFSTATSGTTGNDGNIIEYNDITSATDANRPVNAIYSAGTSAKTNSGNIIRNNNIFNFFNRGIASNAMNIAAYNNTWTISDNSFYGTVSLIPTASVAYSVINVSTTTAIGISITGNYIGGSAVDCGATAWTKTNAYDNAFTAININAGTSTASSLQNNTIKNIAWSNAGAANWAAINLVAGAVNVGTITGNTIGSDTGTGSISVTSGATDAAVYGINIISPNTVQCQDNIIGSIATNNSASTNATNVYGIYKSASAGTTIISNNMVGSHTEANSINAISASSANAQTVYGICYGGSATSTIISNNTIANLNNATTHASLGAVIGLCSEGTGTSLSVSSNFIHNLTLDASSTAQSVYGLKISNGSTANTYSNNIITLGGNTASTIYGIYDTGGVAYTCNLYFNTVYINGSLGSGITNKSYALYSNGATNTRNFRNNILSNARSTTSGTGLHYGAWFNYTDATGLTLGYNDYYVTGTGGVLGHSNSTDQTALPLVATVDAGSSTVDPQFYLAGGTSALDYKPIATITGVAGTGVTLDYEGYTRNATPVMGAFDGLLVKYVEIWNGTLQNTFSTIKEAFDAINAGSYTGALTIKITGNVSESSSAVLNASGTGGASYTSLDIYPTGAYSISGNVNAAMISLNGADYVTFYGSINGTGTTKNLTISNSSATNGASTIQFSNSAEHNTVKYCTIKGSQSSSIRGVIYFTTSTAGNGNSNNLIDNNDITADAAGRTNIAIYSKGIVNYTNALNTISNNNFYDLFSAGAASSIILLSDFSTAWTISGNNIYETIPFTSTLDVQYNGIYINNASGTGFVITDNYIGGNAASCGGSAWTISGANNTFNGILLNVGTGGTATSVQNNTIKNFSNTNTRAAFWSGIYVSAGDVNIGTSTGNTIGSTSGTSSINYSAEGAGGTIYGINLTSTGTIDCLNNSIGGITSTNTGAGTTATSSIYCIYKSATTGAITISNNIIGSTTDANNINASKDAGQNVNGIRCLGTGTVSIAQNTIANITNASSTTGNVVGIYYSGGTGENLISKNFIHSLSVPSSSTATLYGIYSLAGNITYSNNIINLGGNTAITIYGISSTGVTNNNNNFYFNTIHIGGAPTAGSKTSYALYTAATLNTRILKNNIFCNVRSNSGATGKHYAAYLATGTGLTSDYNDYYAPGVNGTLGYVGADKTTLAAWQTATGGDALSLNVNPTFTSAGSTTATDYGIGVDLVGATATGITTDYALATRAAVPTMGAYERNLNSWIGGTTDWNTAGNWSNNSIPGTDTHIIFNPAATSNCALNADKTVLNIYNASAAHLITNGYKLTLKGEAFQTGTGKVDASAPSSTIEYAGVTAQTIPSGTFVGNDIYNLTISNSNNVTLSGSLNITNAFTATSAGRLDATANSTTVSYGGIAQNLSGKFLNETAHNLIVDNACLTVDADFTVNNVLTVNAAKQLMISTAKEMNVVGTITNSGGVDGIWIKASTNGSIANGTLIFHNDQQDANKVQGTVEMYTKASKPAANYKWQFFGIPVRSITANPTFYGSYVRKMYETGTTTAQHWVQLVNASVLTSFAGYEITQITPKVITYQGTLENRDFSSGQLSYTVGAAYPGEHLIANPYTAAIDISKIVFGSSDAGIIENTVYLYNTGSLADWTAAGSGTPGAEGSTPGQFISVPFQNAGAGGLPTQIPSMQAFSIQVLSDNALATVSIPYAAVANTVVKNTTLQRAKASAKISTRIDVKGTTYADQMWLISEPSATRGFDNGWDGYKFLGSAVAPQLFSMESSGDYQVNTVDDFNNTELGFKAGVDANYTLTFTHENLELQYPILYLKDLLTGDVRDITANGSTYSFTATSTATPTVRFKITTQLENTTAVSTPTNNKLRVYSIDNKVVVNNQTDENGCLYLYDVTGRFIQKQLFASNTITTIPMNITAGTYMAKAITKNEKVRIQLIIKSY